MSDLSIIGLGAMGSALAATYLDRGLRVTVWNRTPARAQPLVERGARQATDAAEAIAASPVTLISLLDYPATRGVLEDAAAALPNRDLIQLTNGSPEQVRHMAAWVEARGARYLDGAIMVTPEMVGQPDAFVLYSGPEALYRDHEARLRLLGEPAYLGEDIALATVHDVALLSAMFGMFGGYLHAAALLHAQAISVTDATPMVTSVLHAMIGLLPETAREIDAGDSPQPGSNNLMMATALRNIVQSSHELGVRDGLMDAIRQLFDRGVAEGLGARDISALVPLLQAPPRPPAP
jgi:3-hydroxyisobutyrate dehydrogenase-like beta-hydroxyacid dehydrogenase